MAITGVGVGLMVTLYNPVVTLQFPLSSVTCTLPAPAAPHCTSMLTPRSAVIVPPTTLQVNVLAVAAVLYTTPLSFAHTPLSPLITGVGLASNVINWLAVAEHPAAVVSVILTVPLTPLPHVTMIVLVPAPVVIVPPVTVQLYVLPVPVTLYSSPTVPAHTVVLPLVMAITGVGVGLMVTLYNPVVTLQFPLSSVTCTLPAPAAPHCTSMLSPLSAVIVPPTTLQVNVLAVAAVLYTTPLSFAHTPLSPLITGVGLASNVINWLAVA